MLIRLFLEHLQHSSISSGRQKFITYCVDKTHDSKMVLNGTLNCAGNLGGLIETKSTNCKIGDKKNKKT